MDAVALSSKRIKDVFARALWKGRSVQDGLVERQRAAPLVVYLTQDVTSQQFDPHMALS